MKVCIEIENGFVPGKAIAEFVKQCVGEDMKFTPASHGKITGTSPAGQTVTVEIIDATEAELMAALLGA